MTPTDDVVLVAGPVLGVRLQGELRVVVQMAVAVVPMVVMMLMVMLIVILHIGELLRLGHLLRVGIGAVRVRQEQAVEGKEDEEGDTGEEGAPGKAMAVPVVVTVCMAMALIVVMIVLVSLSGLGRFVLLLLVLVAVAIAVVLGDRQVGECEKTSSSSRLYEGRGNSVAVATTAASSPLHNLRDHVHQHGTQDNTTSKAVAVGHDQTGLPHTALNQKWQVTEDRGDHQEGTRADELLDKEGNN